MAARRLEFRILGPLAVRVDGKVVPVGGPKQRAVLALLLLSANRVVSRERLITELFADQGVNSAGHALRNQVSRLRKVISPEPGDEPRLVARSPGYLLRVEPGELDLDRFELLVAEGHELLAAGEPAQAAASLRAAEELWAGRPLADLEFEPFARVDVERLEELRLAAVEERVDAELALGRHLAVVPELEALAEEHPYRERFRVQLMLALYRGGRQAEGLDVYRRTRTLLNDELGLEPGVELQQLERAILVQDPTLDLPAPGRDHARRPPRDVCPFKGLAPFEEADAEFFFGRERLVGELVARMGEASLLAVVGPSGSGKSSLLRAGLVPALAEEALLVRPAERPAADLAAAVERSTADRLVLVVDQFEEVFAAPAAERCALVDLLVDLAWDPERPVLVLIGLRADFFGHLAAHAALADLVGANHVLLGPMTVGELRRAIEGPAAQAGLDVEPQLVDALVEDVAGEPGGLPLLSTALLDLWRDRADGSLTLAAYERSGGVRGAVARHAESAWHALGQEDQPIARRILLRLVAGGDTEPFTRRRVSREELDADDENVAAVLAVLVERRLLVASGDDVELVHEALLERWPRFAEWLEEDAHGRRLHAHLARTAGEWERAGRDPGELYRGARLAAAVEWAEATGQDAGLNRLEREFLDASRTDFARSNRRLRTLLAAAVLLLCLAVVAGAVALAARGTARRQATAAVAERLGAQALLEPRLDRSLLLAREGVNLDDSGATRGNLLADLLRSPAAIGVAREGSDRLLDEALSADGRLLAVRGNDGHVAFIDARTFRQVGQTFAANSQIDLMGDKRGPLHALAFAPGGKTLAVGGTDGHLGRLNLVSTATHMRTSFSPGKGLFIADAVESPDGRTIATAEPAVGNVSPPPTVITVRDARSGQARVAGEPIAGARLAGFTRDGGSLLVVTSPAQSILLDARTLRRTRRIAVGGEAAVSPAADVAAFGHEDGSVTLVDLRTGTQRAFEGSAGASVEATAFSRDGSLLATATDTGPVALWDVRTHALREILAGHSGAGEGVDFSPDGRTLYAASTDGSVIAWDVSGTRRLDRAFRFAPRSYGSSTSAVSPDGTLFAVSPGRDSVTLRRSATLHPARTLHGPIGDVANVSFGPGGTLVAATGTERAVVWNAKTGAIVRTFPVGPYGSNDVSLSADGHTVAVGAAALELGDLRSGKHVNLPSKGTVVDTDFSPDGRLVASASLNGTVTVWNVARRTAVQKLTGPVSAFSVAFAPDGKRLAVGDNAGTVVVWDVATGARTGPPLSGHNGGVPAVAFDPTGTMVVTSGFDGQLRMWDLATGKLIGAPLPGGDGGGSVEFFPDGKRLLAGFGGGQAVMWNVDPAAWMARACSVAGRNLTRSEWRSFLGGRAYRPVCP